MGTIAGTDSGFSSGFPAALPMRVGGATVADAGRTGISQEVDIAG